MYTIFIRYIEYKHVCMCVFKKTKNCDVSFPDEKKDCYKMQSFFYSNNDVAININIDMVYCF